MLAPTLCRIFCTLCNRFFLSAANNTIRSITDYTGGELPRSDPATAGYGGQWCGVFARLWQLTAGAQLHLRRSQVCDVGQDPADYTTYEMVILLDSGTMLPLL